MGNGEWVILIEDVVYMSREWDAESMEYRHLPQINNPFQLPSSTLTSPRNNPYIFACCSGRSCLGKLFSVSSADHDAAKCCVMRVIASAEVDG